MNKYFLPNLTKHSKNSLMILETSKLKTNKLWYLLLFRFYKSYQVYFVIPGCICELCTWNLYSLTFEFLFLLTHEIHENEFLTKHNHFTVKVSTVQLTVFI